MKTWTLRQARQRAGFTQDALAAESGVKQSTISSYERGTRLRPAYDIVTRLAKALKIRPVQLQFSAPEPEAIGTRLSDRPGHSKKPREAVI